MSTTRLADIVEPEKFTKYMYLTTMLTNALYRSGIVVTNDKLTQAAGQGGKTITIPHFEPISKTEPNVSSDDPAQKSTPNKIGTGKQEAVKLYQNNSWSSMDLTMAVSGEDPMKVIGDQLATYWSGVMQDVAVQSLKGIEADNVANDDSDMVHNVAVDADSAVLDTELISAKAVIATRLTMGDAGKAITAICMHSVVAARLSEINAIELRNITIAGSEVSLELPHYLGLRVIIDDECPVVMGTHRPIYTSYLFGAGAFGYGSGMPKVPHEVDRDPAAGQGGGQETVFSRSDYIMHPAGYQFDKSGVSGEGPTYAELANGANWTRVYERKRVPIAILKTNG